MSKYMRNQFSYFGIKKPVLVAVEKEWIRDACKDRTTWDHSLIRALWTQPQREYKYVAMDLLLHMKAQVRTEDLSLIEYMIDTESWWDTVDLIASHFLGALVQKHPEIKDTHIRKWGSCPSNKILAEDTKKRSSKLGAATANASNEDGSADEPVQEGGVSMWLRRSAIISQLKLKTKTDELLLAECIQANMHTQEFFLNKAIGWALREYSKTNQQFVKDMLKLHNRSLHSLSIREASKYLTKTVSTPTLPFKEKKPRVKRSIDLEPSNTSIKMPTRQSKRLRPGDNDL
jgi:3-methyladenine DNA glycosylase AlkD